MSSICEILQHKLDKKVALKRIQELLPNLASKYSKLIENFEQETVNDKIKFSFDISVFPFFGHVNGVIMVNKDNVSIDGQFPDTLSFLKQNIINAIKKEGEDLLV